MNRKLTFIAAGVAAAIGLGLSGFAIAKDQGGMGGGRGHHGMMGGGMGGEAGVTACANQTEGANVSFNLPMWDVAVNGQCVKMQDGKLVAMPAKMVAHMQASQAACAGKAEGDKVTIASMQDASKTIDATCTKHGDKLIAHPAGMGGMRGHGGDHHGDHHGWDKNAATAPATMSTTPPAAP